MQTEKDRILELRKALEYHNYKYYIENAPEISDREFDGLMHDLEKLEEMNRGQEASGYGSQFPDPTGREGYQSGIYSGRS